MTPIKGMTDNSAPRFPLLGKLRKGGEQTDPKKPGPELPHWRFTSETEDIVTAFRKEYGMKPTELEVLLPFRDLDDNWGTWQEAWVAGGFQHRCNGEFCVSWLKEDGSGYAQDPLDDKGKNLQLKPCPGGCKQVGRLSLILTPLLKAGHWGFVTMETHSINDLISIQGVLNAATQAAGERGLQNIPFILKRVEREISTPGPEGKRVRRKKYMVELVLLAEWVREQMVSRSVAGLLAEDDDDDPPWDDESVDAGTGEVLTWHFADDNWTAWLGKAMKAYSVDWPTLINALKEDSAFAGPLTKELATSAKAHLAAVLAQEA